MKSYRNAAEQGVVAAQYKISMRYDIGKGVNQDYLKVAKWYLKAAEQGNTHSRFMIGMAFNVGSMGVEKKQGFGKKWLIEAAKQGH